MIKIVFFLVLVVAVFSKRTRRDGLESRLAHVLKYLVKDALEAEAETGSEEKLTGQKYNSFGGLFGLPQKNLPKRDPCDDGACGYKGRHGWLGKCTFHGASAMKSLCGTNIFNNCCSKCGSYAVELAPGTNKCSKLRMLSESQCREYSMGPAFQRYDAPDISFDRTFIRSNWPRGCTRHNNKHGSWLYFNAHPTGGTSAKYSTVTQVCFPDPKTNQFSDDKMYARIYGKDNIMRNCTRLDHYNLPFGGVGPIWGNTGNYNKPNTFMQDVSSIIGYGGNGGMGGG